MRRGRREHGAIAHVPNEPDATDQQGREARDKKYPSDGEGIAKRMGEEHTADQKEQGLAP